MFPFFIRAFQISNHGASAEDTKCLKHLFLSFFSSLFGVLAAEATPRTPRRQHLSEEGLRSSHVKVILPEEEKNKKSLLKVKLAECWCCPRTRYLSLLDIKSQRQGQFQRADLSCHLSFGVPFLWGRLPAPLVLAGGAAGQAAMGWEAARVPGARCNLIQCWWKDVGVNEDNNEETRVSIRRWLFWTEAGINARTHVSLKLNWCHFSWGCAVFLWLLSSTHAAGAGFVWLGSSSADRTRILDRTKPLPAFHRLMNDSAEIASKWLENGLTALQMLRKRS